MKRLVLAWYAQYWVGAGLKEFKGDYNGIQPRTFYSLRPNLVELVLRIRIKPIMWRNLWIVQLGLSGTWEQRQLIKKCTFFNKVSLLETGIAKKHSNSSKQLRKTPRMYFVRLGLQCILSGNQVIEFGNSLLLPLKGNRFLVTKSRKQGNPT